MNLPHICLGCTHCYLTHPKIPRHTRIPTATAAINPKTPAIMSQSELRILLSIRGPLFKDHSQMQCRANKLSFEEISLSPYAE